MNVWYIHIAYLINLFVYSYAYIRFFLHYHTDELEAAKVCFQGH